MAKKEKYRIVDLFAGCGGISKGFNNTGKVNVVGVFQLDSTKQIIANNQMMVDKEYPKLKPNREYILYVVGDEITKHPNYQIESFKEEYAPKLKKGSPFFVRI